MSSTPLGHVFVSYAHADRERVEKLVDYLANRKKLEVWWDSRLEPGEQWRQVLTEKLRTAACVVVVWTKRSVKSLFVNAEASAALKDAGQRGALLSVKFDMIKSLPLPFDELQHTDLSNWKGESHTELGRLSTRIRKLIRRPPQWDYSGTLEDGGWSVKGPQGAARAMRRMTDRTSALADVLGSESEPAAAMLEALAEVHNTYDAVTDAITEFVSPAVSGRRFDGSAYARFERGKLKKRIRDGRGHCTQIARIYGRRGGLRDWLAERTTPGKLRQADRVFAQLSLLDGDLFEGLAEIGNVLTNESRAIMNLITTDQVETARKRIIRGRKRLAPLERELDKGIAALQKVEQKLGRTA